MLVPWPLRSMPEAVLCLRNVSCTALELYGQVLRYMGWVKKNLCVDGQPVKGLVICRDPDPKLSYALAMTKDIDVRYYTVAFKLAEVPNQ
jgi:hypothetical protein